MANTIESVIPAGLRDRARKAQLASDRRTGAHSRRQIRERQRRWLRRQWRVLVVTAALSGLAVALVHAFVWERVAPYAIGALLASAGWLIHTMMLEASGVRSRRSGILGEERTANELRQLRREDWIVVNHVMLEKRDVDHVLLGPGGFLAIETKFRTDWGAAKPDLIEWARVARKTAHQVGSRLQQWKTPVRPIVVMWGPDVSANFPEVTKHDDVTFCPGHKLLELIRSLPRTVETHTVKDAFEHLDDCVRSRDWGEVQEFGQIPRNVGQVTNDLMAVGVAWIASTMAVLTPASVSPKGFWSFSVAAGLFTAALLVRRSWPDSPRVQRVTTAIITTCSALGVLLAVSMTVQALA